MPHTWVGQSFGLVGYQTFMAKQLEICASGIFPQENAERIMTCRKDSAGNVIWTLVSASGVSEPSEARVINVTKDLRTILDGADYTKFRRGLWEDQQGCCIECEAFTSPTAPIEWDNSFHVAHRGSRGMGSSFRDDVVGVRKGQVKGGLCGRCHRKEHGQQMNIEFTASRDSSVPQGKQQ